MTMATVYRHTETLDSPANFLNSASEFIRSRVSHDEKVVCALSGGVDSSAAAMLFERAVGDRLYPIHFDTGFMRRIRGREEVELVSDIFGHMENFEMVDRSELFHERVFGIEDSEEKRIAFRDTYEQVLNEEIERIGANVIAQGTIKPDIMETEGEIKSQNNVDTDFEVEKMVEPLAGLYKPQVRLLAKELELPERVYFRQPFPGPGLSVRAVGTIDDSKLENEKDANDLVERFVEGYFEDNYGRMNLWDEESGSRVPFQYFAVTLDQDMEYADEINDYLKNMGLEAEAFSLSNRATGVELTEEGRTRVYSPVVLLRGRLEQEMVYYLGTRIPERFDASRVLFQLKDSDEEGWVVGLRLVDSEDAVDAEPLKVPFSELEKLSEEIIEKTDSGIVGFDVTPKPPATIEYE